MDWPVAALAIRAQNPVAAPNASGRITHAVRGTSRAERAYTVTAIDFIMQMILIGNIKYKTAKMRLMDMDP